MIDSQTGFHYNELKAGVVEKDVTIINNLFIFILEGNCKLGYNNFKQKAFKSGDLIFIPKESIASGEVHRDIKFITMSFSAPLNPCDKQAIVNLSHHRDNSLHKFSCLRFTKPLRNFLNSLTDYLNTGGNCIHLHEIKHKELFLILRWYYTKEELASLLYPIISNKYDFKTLIIESYNEHNSLDALIEASKMSRTTFMRKFKSSFGIPVYQWILKQTCNRILELASRQNITIKDIMREINVSNASHFNRLCKRHFDCTPRALIASYQNDVKK